MARLIWVLVVSAVVWSPSAEADKSKRKDKDFAPFDSKASAKRLQGIWVTDKAQTGQWAWRFKGKKLTIFDGVKEKTYRIKSLSPCMLFGQGKGGFMGRLWISYAFSGDKLYLGLGLKGIAKDGVTLACQGPEVVFVARGDACERITVSSFNGKRDRLKATCKDTEKNGKTVFKFRGPHGTRDLELERLGDVLLGGQSRNELATPVKSWREAKKLAAP